MGRVGASAAAFEDGNHKGSAAALEIKNKKSNVPPVGGGRGGRRRSPGEARLSKISNGVVGTPPIDHDATRTSKIGHLVWGSACLVKQSEDRGFLAVLEHGNVRDQFLLLRTCARVRVARPC